MTTNRFFAAVILVAMSATTVSGQVAVTKQGQLRLGKHQENSAITPGGPGIAVPLSNGATIGPGSVGNIEVDSLSQLLILGPGCNNGGGYISFGDRDNVRIGEDSLTDNRLMLKGEGGLVYRTGGSDMMKYDGGRFHFDCMLMVDGVLVRSDSRLKKDIKGLDDAYKDLSRISGISYSLAGEKKEGKKTAAGNGAEADKERTRYGFVAQEVKEVFPDLVAEDKEGYMSVDYIGFIPLLVDAVKELRAEVEEQKRVIETLEGGVSPSMSPAAGKRNAEGKMTEQKASLAQNRPNPFRETTVIECTLPESVGEAMVCVYDLQGRQVRKLPVEGRGKTSVRLEGSGLGAGMYVYALVADGEEVESRRMILTD